MLFLQYVPLIVETCTKIVEDRGIENQGIYRVPGNSSAVNTLRDELNKVGSRLIGYVESLLSSILVDCYFRVLCLLPHIMLSTVYQC